MSSPVERANAIRALAMDAVENCGNGHPGAPMGLADVAEVLWREVLRHNPRNPKWPNRDRFVLSNGHGSMLLYALLHLTGYDLPIEQIKTLRQWGSKTPGHPEWGHTPGVETTTGPLGQGLANAVGMAIAERVLAARFNRPGHTIVDHRTFVVVGDGCLMEGISHEAASLAGTFALSKLICVYDDNGISIDGPVQGWFSDDTAKRFEAYQWRVIRGVDGHDAKAIAKAFAEATDDCGRPTLICCKTQIGRGAPKKAGTASAHGAALGADEVAGARTLLGWSHAPFVIPDALQQDWSCVAKGAAVEQQWQQAFTAYRQAHPPLAEQFLQAVAGELPKGALAALDELIAAAQQQPVAMETRKASGTVLETLGPKIAALIGGSADLSGSNNTLWKGAPVFSATNGDAQYINYGVREFAMTAIGNGIALHGGLIPYAGTFLVFMEYARNALRLAALMGLRHILVYTHDSLAVGEDGPTHQPVEQLTTLRTTPNLSVWRPADLVETAVAWRCALTRSGGPTTLVLSRQKTVPISRSQAQLGNVQRGGYVLVEPTGKVDVILIATGSEVGLTLTVAIELAKANVGARVVSMPSSDVFLAQDAAYREQVLPNAERKRVAIEAAHPDWWYRLVGLDGLVIGVDRFGASAPGEKVMKEYGFSVESILGKVRGYLA